MLRQLAERFLVWLTRPGRAALDALDDPEARRDCPGDACAGVAEAPENPASRQDFR